MCSQCVIPFEKYKSKNNDRNFDKNILRNVDKPVVDNMGIERKQAYFEISVLEHKLLLVEQ